MTKTNIDQHGPMGDWKEHVKVVLRALAFKLWTFQVLPALVVGAVLLGGAIGAWRDAQGHLTKIAPLTATAAGQVEASWWRLDIDTRSLSDGATNWAAMTKPSLCMQYTFDQNRSTACLRYGEILDFTQAPYQLYSLARSMGVPWRDRDGNPQVSLHFPAAAWQWMNENQTPYEPFTSNWTPEAGFGPEGEMTYFDAFMRTFDLPTEYVLTLWQLPREFDVVYDPQDPSNAMPASFAESERFDEGPPINLMLGLFGALFWAVGIWMIFVESGKVFRIAAVVVTLGLAPWWGSWVWRGLDFVYAGASDFGRMLSSGMMFRPAVVDVFPGQYGGEDGDIKHRWALDSSLYSPIFERFSLTSPESALSQNEARSEADRQLQAALVEMSADEKQKLFVLLACYAAAGLRGAGDLFLEVGRYWQSDEDVGTSAARFVEYQQDGGVRFHNLDCASAL